MKKRRPFLKLVVAAFIGAPFLVPLLIPWSGINCRVSEIDLLTGERRASRLLYWVPIYRRISATPVSSVLGTSNVGLGRDWRRVGTSTLFVSHSPHYSFHSAYQQPRRFELIWEEVEFSEEARRESAQELLERWRLDDSDSAGDDYLNELMEQGEQASDGDD